MTLRPCNLCRVTKHLRTQHRTGECRIRCSFCATAGEWLPTEYGATLAWNEEMQRTRKYPVRILRSLCTYKCDVCDLPFNTRNGLGCHKSRIHGIRSTLKCNMAR